MSKNKDNNKNISPLNKDEKNKDIKQNISKDEQTYNKEVENIIKEKTETNSKKDDINDKGSKDKKKNKKKSKLFARDKTPNFDFFKHRMVLWLIPIILIIGTIVASMFIGINVDIKFKGGTIVNIPYADEIDLNEAKDTIETTLNESCIVQKGESESSNQLVITLTENKDLSPQEINKLLEDLKIKFEDNLKDINTDEVQVTSVDPQIGLDFFKKCLVAVAAAFIAIIIYIGIRFRKIGGISAGIMGIISLFHDIAFVFAAIVFFKFPINDAFMAIVLTILGYSINNTIVIYDRIRENRKEDKTIREVVNLSINQTLSRSINTTLTTVLALTAMLITAFITHIDTIVSFVTPLIFGMLAGLYSSIFISAPLWVWWKEKRGNKDKSDKRKKPKRTKKQYIETDPALSIPDEIDVKTNFKIDPKAMEKVKEEEQIKQEEKGKELERAKKAKEEKQKKKKEKTKKEKKDKK